MPAELVLLAAALLLIGWTLRAWVTRIAQTRANAHLERMLAQRIARFPTGYAPTERGGRRVLP